MASTLLVKLTLFAAIISIAYSVGIYEQCAGEGYGNFPCNAGLTCFRRNRFYSSCQYSCPRNLGWECETYPTVAPGYLIAAGWDQCAGEGWGVARPCAAGFACYARSVYYSQVSDYYYFIININFNYSSVDQFTIVQQVRIYFISIFLKTSFF
jgi:hypothetical protein